MAPSELISQIIWRLDELPILLLSSIVASSMVLKGLETELELMFATQNQIEGSEVGVAVVGAGVGDDVGATTDGDGVAALRQLLLHMEFMVVMSPHPHHHF